MFNTSDNSSQENLSQHNENLTIHLYNAHSISYHAANLFGISAALMLNRVIWSIQYHLENADRYKDTYFVDGRWWMNDTSQAIANHFGGLISAEYVRKTLRKLEADGVLIAMKPRGSKWDQTKWYSLNIERWNEIHGITQQIQNRGKKPVHTGDKIRDKPGIKSGSSSSNNLTSNLPKTTTADNPQDSKIDEAAEVLAVYESKFGRAGKRAREDFKMSYVSESSSKEKMLQMIDRFYSDEAFIRPTTHSPMRLFYGESILNHAKALRYKVCSDLGGSFDRKLTMGRLKGEQDLRDWFNGDAKLVERCMMLTIQNHL